MPSRLVADKKRYLYAVYIGEPTGNFVQRLFYTVRRWWWTKKLERMSEGEILGEYYRLTRRNDEDDDYIIQKVTGMPDR